MFVEAIVALLLLASFATAFALNHVNTVFRIGGNKELQILEQERLRVRDFLMIIEQH